MRLATTMEMTTAAELDQFVTIDRRFRGPADSANGGYSAGLLGRSFYDACEVTLLRPPPLEQPLRIVAGEELTLEDDEGPVARARATTLDIDVPTPPTFFQAADMRARFTGHDWHPCRGCFVCGPERAHGDGLRVLAGPSADPSIEMVASPWRPDASLADGLGPVPEEIVWAALDCPGYFSIGEKGEVALLGRMTAQVFRSVYVGERCVVVGWPIAREGRKLRAGTALFDRHGELVAASSQIWIRVDRKAE